jgi:hypothetical protein
MSRSRINRGGLVLSAAAVTVLGMAQAPAMADDRRGVSQSGEQKNMRRVGHADLQGRAAYHPTFKLYPDGSIIAFVGTHSSATSSLPPGSIDSNVPKLNPLTKNIEPNGTMIVDITNPSRPVETFHIPGPAAGAQTQSNRVCLGSELPQGTPGRVYMMRNVQTGNLTLSGYEVYDVTDIRAPKLVSSIRNMRNTHKHWWECKTGIAYLPGSMNTPRWRQGQSMVIVDWKNPNAAPIYLRTHGLPGGQPSGTGPVPTSLHGPISTHEHPNAAAPLARARPAGPTVDDTIGNRIYLAWGVGDDGVLQILDRKATLPPPYGTWIGDPNDPTNEQLESAQASILYMSPDQGGHTSFPFFGVKPKSYQDFTEFKTRDIVHLASESTSDRCEEAPHWSFIVDVTVENSKSAPPGTRVQQNVWQGPMVLSTMWLDPRAGEKYPRGNYCKRGARFGVHSSEENFTNPFYPRATFIAYFTGGVRAYDIREPQGPVEIGFYVPESNKLTEADGYMTNNLEVDDRGYILAVDRNGAGLDIIELAGKAKKAALGQDDGKDDDGDD